MIVLRGGKVYDPAHHIDGEIKDIWIDGGKIVVPPAEDDTAQVIDVGGLILAPAGVEIHAHVAGSQLNAARAMLAGQTPVVDSLLPTPAQAAERYLKLGYTTVFDAAMPPLYARQSHADLADMAGVDRGSYTLMGDHMLLMQAAAHNDPAELRDVIAWLLQASGGYAVKLVNPGGGLAWKLGHPTPGLDDPVIPGGPTQRQFIQQVASVVNAMSLPHPIHLHAGRLGRPGNWQSFCETVRSLAGLRAHLCHIQFYCYGADDKGGFTSAAAQVAECIAQYPQLTFDVGQVLFGAAAAITADVSAIGFLRAVLHTPWYSRMMEGEGGGSVLPLSYLAKDAASSVQWAAGLELLLRFPDPSRMFLTTDHPNGGQFTSYPHILAWLMSKETRDRDLSLVHAAGREKSGLAALEREYSLAEVVAMTSWGPAKALGLEDRGHLGVGARADIRCYQPQADIEAMFATPKWVMRAGEMVMKDGQIVARQPGQTLAVRPEWDEDRREKLYDTLSSVISVAPQTYALGDRPRDELKVVPCKSKA
ncbi:MAG: formylmethanofuran dehydrogenase subunit A [Anaerolineaceae bacterium]|jgi:formylmethanofuran dehydrogenase subunit A